MTKNVMMILTKAEKRGNVLLSFYRRGGEKLLKGFVRQGITFLLAFTLLAGSFQSVLATEAAGNEGGVNGTQEESSAISTVDESSMVNGWLLYTSQYWPPSTSPMIF